MSATIIDCALTGLRDDVAPWIDDTRLAVGLSLPLPAPVLSPLCRGHDIALGLIARARKRRASGPFRS